MLWFYAQQIVFIAVDATLFAMVALHLLTPQARMGGSERRTRRTLGFLGIALAFLGLLHLMRLGVLYASWNLGGQLASLVQWVSSILAVMIYIGFGFCLAAAIRQLMKAATPEGTVEPASNLNRAPAEATDIQLTQQKTDWGYVWKQTRIGFFRCIGFMLLLGAAPLAFVQEIPGVGLMALLTGLGCLWLGFHRKSPLAIKYASLAEEETNEAGR